MNVLLTGAGSGIGAAIASLYADNGHRVYALDIKPAAPAKNITPFAADIRDEGALSAVAQALREQSVQLDCIINVAGIFLMDSFLEIGEDKLRAVFDVNLLGAVRVNKIFFPLLRKNGKIFITTSEVAPLDPLPFNGIYGVSKTALDAYAQALRHEAGLLGAKVVTVRPGAIRTPLAQGSVPAMRKMSETSAYFGGQAEKFQRIMEKFTGRMLAPERVAQKIYKVSFKKCPKCVYRIHNNVLLKLLSALPKRWQVAIIYRLLGGKKAEKARRAQR
ncbi:MAG: hypothetical protein DBX59_03235 [Bacillota bacterium]|nr:MAG: hypothetical protein DBX59_03235 [Bacillota bacterium]